MVPQQFQITATASPLRGPAFFSFPFPASLLPTPTLAFTESDMSASGEIGNIAYFWNTRMPMFAAIMRAGQMWRRPELPVRCRWSGSPPCRFSPKPADHQSGRSILPDPLGPSSARNSRKPERMSAKARPTRGHAIIASPLFHIPVCLADKIPTRPQQPPPVSASLPKKKAIVESGLTDVSAVCRSTNIEIVVFHEAGNLMGRGCFGSHRPPFGPGFIVRLIGIDET